MSPAAAPATTASDDKPKRVTRRRAETRERLLTAALEVFAEHGLGATVEQICEQAGYTRGAFYSNFRTAEELFFALYEQRGAALLERTREALLSADVLSDLPDLEGVVENAVERFLAAVRHDRAWWLVSTEYLLYAARNREAARRLGQFRRQFRAQLTELLTAALARAGREPVIAPERLAEVLMAMHDGALAHSYAESGAVGYEELDRLAFPHLVRGLSRAVSPKPARKR